MSTSVVCWAGTLLRIDSCCKCISEYNLPLLHIWTVYFYRGKASTSVCLALRWENQASMFCLAVCSVYTSMAKEGQMLTQAGVNQESQMLVSHFSCDVLVRKLFENITNVQVVQWKTLNYSERENQRESSGFGLQIKFCGYLEALGGKWAFLSLFPCIIVAVNALLMRLK